MDPTAQEYERWRMPRYLAEMWWCGDEECDCYQPQIELVTPNLTAGFPWVRRTRLWEGAFATDGGTPSQQQELEQACVRAGIPLGESPAWQDWPYSIAEDVDTLEMAVAHAEGTKPNALFRGGPLDGQAKALPEPPPPTWRVPVREPVVAFTAAAVSALPIATGPKVLEYRVRSRRPLVYQLSGSGRLGGP